MVEELQSEIEEVLHALDNNDVKNFTEEIGDVFWDVMGVLVAAEQQKLLKVDKLLGEVAVKFKLRKPFLLTGMKVTLEEESRMWEEQKRKEKKLHGKNPTT